MAVRISIRDAVARGTITGLGVDVLLSIMFFMLSARVTCPDVSFTHYQRENLSLIFSSCFSFCFLDDVQLKKRYGEKCI